VKGLEPSLSDPLAADQLALRTSGPCIGMVAPPAAPRTYIGEATNLV